jgi:Predicted ATPase
MRSRTIGRVTWPESWYKKMQNSDLIVLDISNEERVQNILKEYVIEALKHFPNNNELLAQYLSYLDKIKKRLGGELHKKISSLMINAFDKDKNHEDWISKLLIMYYDPMYKYKLNMRKKNITHIGDYKSCYEYLVGL